MESTKWVPITRGHPDVKGFNDRYKGLLDVEFVLDRDPPAEWKRAFLNPFNVEISMGYAPPRLEGSTITLRPPQDQFENAVAHIDARIEHANEKYGREFFPAAEMAREREQRQHAEDKQRLEAIRKRAEKL